MLITYANSFSLTVYYLQSVVFIAKPTYSIPKTAWYKVELSAIAGCLTMQIARW